MPRPQQQATEFLAAASQANRPGVLLFTAKYDTSLLYKSLAHQLRDIMNFGEVRASNAVLADRFGVGKYPMLLVFCGGDESKVRGHGTHPPTKPSVSP